MMRISRAAAAVAVCAVMFGAGAGVGYFAANKALSDSARSGERQSVVRSAEAQAGVPHIAQPTPGLPDIYIIRIEGGHVGIFRLEGETPRLMYYSDKINVNALPASERKRLEDGITAQSSEELAALLEALGS